MGPASTQDIIHHQSLELGMTQAGLRRWGLDVGHGLSLRIGTVQLGLTFLGWSMDVQSEVALAVGHGANRIRSERHSFVFFNLLFCCVCVFEIMFLFIR